MRRPTTWNSVVSLMGSTTRTSSLSRMPRAAPSAPRSAAARSASACEISSEETAPANSALSSCSAVDALQRVLGLHSGHGRALTPDPENSRDQDDERGDGEVDGPTRHVVGAADRELSSRLDECPQRQHRSDTEAQRSRPDAAEPRGDGDRADERRIDRIVADREEAERDREARDRQQHGEAIALPGCVNGQPICELLRETLHRTT